MRELQLRRGYQEVSTPILVSERVWRQSGHWDFYRDNMFIVESEKQLFSLKPMNCPESTYIYRARKRSYRDLPLRYNEYGRLHRNERSGALSGLTRVRQFIQDDGHIYVRPDQLAAELEALFGEIQEAYSWVGFTPRFAFATKPDKAVGDPELWAKAEAIIQDTLDRMALPYVVKPKDGTFYAPKIDIYIDDALGREWQMATIQVDLTMLPERFDLTYTAEDGTEQRPMAIHRAIYGSLERFIGILVEHFGGAFPLWLAPVQAVVVPIADRHLDAAGGAGGRASIAGSAGRHRRLLEPDAVQDPDGPGAEGAVHGRPRRPRDRRADGVPADEGRGAAGSGRLGGLRRPPRRRVRRARGRLIAGAPGSRRRVTARHDDRGRRTRSDRGWNPSRDNQAGSWSSGSRQGVVVTRDVTRSVAGTSRVPLWPGGRLSGPGRNTWRASGALRRAPGAARTSSGTRHVPAHESDRPDGRRGPLGRWPGLTRLCYHPPSARHGA